MRIISRICIFSICVMFSSTAIYSQVNEFEGEVKFSNIKKSNNSESILVTDEDGVLSYKEISSFNIPNFIVDDNRIELIVNGESHVLELTDKTNTSQTITNFKLNGRILEIEVSNLKEPLQVDLSPILTQVTRSSATGAFSTTSNVTSNMPGDPTADDLVFGSESLDDTGMMDNDSRVTFDKSKGSFRAGTVDGTQWDEANRGLQSAAFGSNTKAEGASSFATGNESSASGVDAVAMGFTNTSSGNRSFSAGNSNMASGNGSISIGTQNMSTGTSSFAAGLSNTASNNMSVALGNGTTASGISSTSIGTSTVASGNTSFAGGNGALAIGANSLAFGIDSKARQQSSFAFGKDTDTNGKFGLAAGVGVLSQSRAQISLGSYNTSVVGNVNNYIPTDRLFVIGNGEDETQLSDALVMLKNGNTTLNGTLKVDEGGAGNGYTFPGSDGMMNQVMQTDGSGK